MNKEQLLALSEILAFVDRHPKFLTAEDFPGVAVNILRDFYARELVAQEDVSFG